MRGGAPAQAPMSQSPTSRTMAMIPNHYDKRFVSRNQSAVLADESDQPMGPTTDEEKVHRLIELQHFEGSWDLDDEVAGILGFESLQQSCAGKEERSKDKKWATLLVVAFLEGQMALLEGVWELVVEKAKGWLGAEGGAEGWEDEARDLVGEIGEAKEMDTTA